MVWPAGACRHRPRDHPAHPARSGPVAGHAGAQRAPAGPGRHPRRQQPRRVCQTHRRRASQMGAGGQGVWGAGGLKPRQHGIDISAARPPEGAHTAAEGEGTPVTNDAGQISRLVLRGYKSIAECGLELRRRNVLIGANGAGKSNFIGFFRLVHQILNQQLQMAVGLAGGPDALLHFGRKKTQELYAAVYFGDGSYSFTLQPTQDNRMMFASEVLSSGELRADDARTQATAQADLHEDLRWHAAIAVLNHPGSSQEQREAARAFMDQWSSKHGPFETSIEEQKKRIGPHHFDLLYPV